MKLRSRLTGTALVLTISAFGLAACGSDGDDAETKDTTSQSDSAPEATQEADDNDAQGKPSKGDVVDGYSKLVQDLAGTELPDGIVKKVVTCFVDEVYDDASPKTLNAIADGDQTGIDPQDASLFTDATSTCQKAAMS